MDNELHRMVGQIQGSLNAIQTRLDEGNERAAARWERFDRQIEEISETTNHTSKRLDDLEKRTASAERHLEDEVRPFVTEVRSFQARVAGGLLVLGFIGSVVMAAFALAKDKILSLLGWS